MTDREVLDALQTLLKPINNRLEDLELKVDTLRLDTKTVNRALRKDIQGLNDEVKTFYQ